MSEQISIVNLFRIDIPTTSGTISGWRVVDYRNGQLAGMIDLRDEAQAHAHAEALARRLGVEVTEK